MRVLIGLFTFAILTGPLAATKFEALTTSRAAYFVSPRYKFRFRIPDGWVATAVHNELPVVLTPRGQDTRHWKPGDLMIQVFAAENAPKAIPLESWAKSLILPGTPKNLEAVDLSNTRCEQCAHRVGYKAVYVDLTYGEPIEYVRLFLDTDSVHVSLSLSYWKDNPEGPRYWKALTQLARSIETVKGPIGGR